MQLSDEEIIQFVFPYTMASRARIENVLALVDAIVDNDIPGDLIEIGVWKGGLIMAMALKCMQLGVVRTIHAYDTFEGMTQPTANDVDLYGNQASHIFEAVKCCSSFEETKVNINKCNYPHIVYHRGDILKTDIDAIPRSIAILRLDTDWYEGTKFELEHFEKHVSTGGYIIIDDYGHWQGCKKAVNEYYQGKSFNATIIDYTGIYWRK